MSPIRRKEGPKSRNLRKILRSAATFWLRLRDHDQTSGRSIVDNTTIQRPSLHQAGANESRFYLVWFKKVNHGFGLCIIIRHGSVECHLSRFDRERQDGSVRDDAAVTV